MGPGWRAVGDTPGVQITARADYAVRAMVELNTAGEKISAEAIAARQEIPRAFLMSILAELRRAKLVTSLRGPTGGWRLAVPAEEVTLADVVRAVEGPLARVNQQRPEDASYHGSAGALQLVWVALRVSIREVMEQVTIAAVSEGRLPEHLLELTRREDAWESRF